MHVLPLDINRSGEKYSVEMIDTGESAAKVVDETISRAPVPAIRVGLMQVKGISKDAIRRILTARGEGGPTDSPTDCPAGEPFRSALDFLYRVDIPRDIVQNLVLAGAFDSVEPNRRALAWRLGSLTGDAAAHRAAWVAARESGQAALRGTFEPPKAYGTHVESEMPDFTEVEKFKREMSILGFCVSHHAMEFFRGTGQRGCPHFPRSAGARHGQRCTAGLVVPTQASHKERQNGSVSSLEDELA